MCKGIMGLERHVTLSGEHTMQKADNVLLSCTRETCMALLAKVNPMNSIKINKIKYTKSTYSIELTDRLCWSKHQVQ